MKMDSDVAKNCWVKAKLLWNKQSRSPLAAETIYSVLGRYLVVPNATRWNYSFDAMDCLRKVMKPFSFALDLLQGEKETTLEHLLPTLVALKLKMTSLLDSAGRCRTFCLELLAGLDKQFGPMFDDKTCILAAVVHPKFKLSFLQNDSKGESQAAVHRRTLQI
ncbi:uncharacterized protein LOC118477350 isoform X2 [Aplysia californica]|uniref:Uncharacterized protein LOC118477350 isoform X2 n=1 Tax=Aplysia californica TaxID=6500 RepID=A0ABM1VPZ6_APLCA|nr:uncharacterized protein LOC118477350 isoform X2 [Aplysia californica]